MNKVWLQTFNLTMNSLRNASSVQILQMNNRNWNKTGKTKRKKTKQNTLLKKIENIRIEIIKAEQKLYHNHLHWSDHYKPLPLRHAIEMTSWMPAVRKTGGVGRKIVKLTSHLQRATGECNFIHVKLYSAKITNRGSTEK